MLLGGCFFSAFAQEELKEIQEKINKGKFVEAKDKLDKFMADPKNQKNANAWYYKGVIYNELAKDTTKPGLDYRTEAFSSLKRYQELDSKNIMMTLEQNGRLFQLYEGFYNEGVRNYNAKAYDKAYQNLRNASAVKDYVYKKGYSYNNFAFPALDTQLLLLTGSAGILTQKEDEAIPYYQMLADAKLRANDYKDIYSYLVEYFSKKKDMANRDKYLQIGTQLYPDDNYWLQVQLNDAVGDKQKLFAKYEELMQKNPNNYYLTYNYAVELYNTAYATDKKPADYLQVQAKMNTILNQAIQINSTPEANLLMARAKYNEIYDLEDKVTAIKGTKPEDIKKRQALNASVL